MTPSENDDRSVSNQEKIEEGEKDAIAELEEVQEKGRPESSGKESAQADEKMFSEIGDIQTLVLKLQSHLSQLQEKVSSIDNRVSRIERKKQSSAEGEEYDIPWFVDVDWSVDGFTIRDKKAIDYVFIFKNLWEQASDMEEKKATEKAFEKTLSSLLTVYDQVYQKFKNGADPNEAMALLESTYKVVRELGYSREDIASELGLGVQTQESKKPTKSEKRIPLEELTEVFDRSYGTLRNWLGRKNLSEYSLREGRTHTFSKESLETFVNRELSSSTRYSTYKIQDIYDRIADRFGGEPKEVKGDDFEKNRQLAATEKLEVLKERLGEEELYRVIQETCTPQRSEYIIEYMEGTSHKEIAEEERLTRGTISEHVAKGADQVWNIVAKELD